MIWIVKNLWLIPARSLAAGGGLVRTHAGEYTFAV